MVYNIKPISGAVAVRTAGDLWSFRIICLKADRVYKKRANRRVLSSGLILIKWYLLR